ncbi:hypothetical protein Golob_007918 [Gossypium lobatum]|uniref:Uncharacterized protein n=1 Tax=Gossypium lobatum TaxID=34289 RepID=A0A7J8MDT9_9ROSI|nr:hypothetical protein [Gossypium lobatum]
MADVPSMSGLSAVGIRDLIGESINSKKNRGLKKSKSTTLPLPGENLSDDQSDDCHSSTTSSSSPASTALREWNGIIREIEKRKNHIRSAASEDGSLLCGLGLSSMKVGCLSPFIVGAASFNEGKNPP